MWIVCLSSHYNECNSTSNCCSNCANCCRRDVSLSGSSAMSSRLMESTYVWWRWILSISCSCNHKPYAAEQWRWGQALDCNQQVVGLIPTGTKLRNNLGHVVHTYAPLSPSSITWYWSKDSDVLRLGKWLQAWRKVMTAYRRGNGLLKVTCGLTACTPGSAPGPTLSDVYGRTYFLLYKRRV